jgi:hypothetical protein
LGEEIAVNFAYEESIFILVGFLTCRKILRHGADGFTSPAKGVLLRIFIALKNPSPSDWFEPATLEPNGKHDNF